MILVWLLVTPIIGGLLAWLAAHYDERWSPWICLVSLFISLGLVLSLWIGDFAPVKASLNDSWAAEFNEPWIPQLGIRFHLALDGLSLMLIALTEVLGLVAVAASFQEIKKRTGFFYFNLMWVLAALIGVFLAVDLFLFYFAWELMLVPMYFLIALWGHERRIYAAVKFFLFTQISGLLMFISILGLYFIHGQRTGIYTFEYHELLGMNLSGLEAMLLMLGFVAAFAVKLPVFGLHTWLPDAHTEAPTAGSVVLAGLLLKTGAYGLLRFAVPLFPHQASDFAPYAMGLGVAGIIYGALQSFGQTDFKRFVAYTSVSHMGFVLLGIYTWNDLALQGVVIQILCHGFATGALFVIAGLVQDRTGTRELSRFEGLWDTIPRLSGWALFFALAAMGLPGLGNFLGEFLILLGAYPEHTAFAVLASLGLIGSTVYALWLVQRAFQGPNRHDWSLPDLSLRESFIMAGLGILLVWLGVYPQPVIDAGGQGLHTLEHTVATARAGTHSNGAPSSPRLELPTTSEELRK